MRKDGSEASIVVEPGVDGRHVTYCRICEAICGMVADVRDGRITHIGPDPDNPHSRGHICVKGVALADVTQDEDRVLYPLKRTGGPGEFERVSWDAALTDIASRLAMILDQQGPAAVAVNYGNPPAFGLGGISGPPLFMAAIGAHKAFSPQTEDTSAPLLAHQLLYGATSYVFPDLPDCEHLLIFGSNPLVSHGSLIIAPRLREDLDAIARRGRVIVVDPRRTESARKYEHVQVRPDSDVWLIAAMIQTIIAEGLADTETIDRHCSGWTEFAQAISTITPDVAAQRCGIEAAAIRTLAIDFAKAERAAAMGRTGICRGRYPTLTNILMHALNIIAGKFHKRGCVGFGHGASDSGDMLASAGMTGYAAGASRTSGLPAVVGSLPSTTLFDEITSPGDGQIRALFVQGANPVMSMPGGARLPQAFAQLDLMVAIDLYVTETTRNAHYILPATTALEREDIPLLFLGHMVRPYAQYVPAVIPPLGESRTEFDIWKALATAMGKEAIFGDLTPIESADLVLRAGPEGDNGGPDGAGVSVEMLKQHPHGVEIKRGRWGFKLQDKLRHPDGRIHLWDDLVASEFSRLAREPARDPDALQLVSSRKLRSINSWMHNVEKLVRHDEPALLIHPDDAAARGLVDGGEAEVSTRWGSVTVVVKLTEDVRRGCVTYPHGWGHQGGWRRANAKNGVNINAIAPATPDSAEQISGMSFLDGYEVTVRPVGAGVYSASALSMPS